MFKTVIIPRIDEVNALRFVKNSSLTVWFESAQMDIVKLFNPTCELTYNKWNLLAVNMDFNFLKHIVFGYDVEIRTTISKVGKTSFTIYQEAWQNEELKANSKTNMIYYDYIKEKSLIIPGDLRKALKEHEK